MQELHLFFFYLKKKKTAFSFCLFLLNFTWTFPFISPFDTLMWVWVFVSELAYIFHGLRIFFMLRSRKSAAMFWIVSLWCWMQLNVDLQGPNGMFPKFYFTRPPEQEGRGRLKTRPSATADQSQFFFFPPSIFFLDCIFFFTAWSFLFVWGATADMRLVHMLIWSLSWCQNTLAKPSQENNITEKY